MGNINNSLSASGLGNGGVNYYGNTINSSIVSPSNYGIQGARV